MKMAASLSQQDAETARRPRPREIETSRLRLRPFTPADLEELSAITADPEVVRYIGDGSPLSRDETWRNLSGIINNFARRGYGRWAVVGKAGGALLGYCGLTQLPESPGVELVYLLARGAWGRGIATEASRACLRYGFEELGLERVYALTMPDNLRSRRVLERVGMRFLRDDCYYGYDCVCYAITREEWRRDASMYRLRPAPE
jgi:RimJ/RimL family protein N-acetyltransferase